MTANSVVDTQAIAIRKDDDVSAEHFLPVLTVDQSLERKEQMNLFISKVLRQEEDYGIIPGTKKPTLLKPGAEKLCSMFGLTPQYTADSIVEDWTGENHGGEPMFYYAYRCSLSRGGRFMGEAIGSCSSWESKYRHRWVREDQLPEGTDKSKVPSKGGRQTLFAYEFAIEKAETDGQYGKPAEYWQRFKAAIADGSAKKINKPFKNGKDGWGYEVTADTTLYRLPNSDVADSVNTIQKMAQKRALLAAVLIVTNASDAFTQDLEDSAELEHAATVPRQEGSGSISSGGELFDNDESEPSPEEKALAQKIAAEKASKKSPQQAQQAAAQAQFEQKQKESQPTPGERSFVAELPVPDELKDLFGRIDKGERGAVPHAFHIMEQSFKQLNSTEADQEYEDLKIKFRDRFPPGGKNKANGLDIKVCLLSMWDAYKRWEQHLEHTHGQHS